MGLTRLLSAFVLLMALTACNTLAIKSFEQVKEGMDKSQVLELIGSPNSSFRKSDVDIWHYRFFDKSEAIEREVRFIQGRVSYSGPNQTPNAILPNLTLETAAQVKASNEKSKPRVYPEPIPTPSQQEKIETYVPQFTPVE